MISRELRTELGLPVMKGMRRGKGRSLQPQDCEKSGVQGGQGFGQRIVGSCGQSYSVDPSHETNRIRNHCAGLVRSSGRLESWSAGVGA